MQFNRTVGGLVRSAAVLGLLGSVSACDLAISDMRAQAREEWTRTYTLPPDGVLEIININGSIDLEASTGTGIEIKAERIAKAPNDEAARELLKRVEIIETTSTGVVRVETKPLRLSGIFSGQTEVRYRVRVPALMRVKAETTNGRVDAIGLRGALHLETTNGGITGRRLAGRVQASTTNGSIEIDLETVSPEGVNLETTNGAITLRVPENAKATINASTVNGRIDPSDFPVQEVDKSRRTLNAHLNGGGARLDLETTNGGIRIARAL